MYLSPASDEHRRPVGEASRSGGDGDTAPARRRVLVVEDDPDAAEVALGMMKLLGFDTTHCADAHEALYALASGAPDLILLDICLPEMDGVNLLKVARRVATGRTVPVIAASAVYPREGAIARSLRELGVEVFLSKPFTLAALREAVQGVVPGFRPAESAPTALERIVATAQIGGRDIPLQVEGGGERQLRLASPDVPIPVGTRLQLRLVRREVVEDRMEDTEILVLGEVSSCAGRAQGWAVGLEVMAARPQRAYDRLVDTLTD